MIEDDDPHAAGRPADRDLPAEENSHRQHEKKIRLRDMPTWPAALTFDEAVAYTGLSASVISKSEMEGNIRFRAIGSNGRKIALRADLDALLTRLFAGHRGILDDMDFGRD